MSLWVTILACCLSLGVELLFENRIDTLSAVSSEAAKLILTALGIYAIMTYRQPVFSKKYVATTAESTDAGAALLTQQCPDRKATTPCDHGSQHQRQEAFRSPLMALGAKCLVGSWLQRDATQNMDNFLKGKPWIIRCVTLASK